MRPCHRCGVPSHAARGRPWPQAWPHSVGRGATLAASPRCRRDTRRPSCHFRAAHGTPPSLLITGGGDDLSPSRDPCGRRPGRRRPLRVPVRTARRRPRYGDDRRPRHRRDHRPPRRRRPGVRRGHRAWHRDQCRWALPAEPPRGYGGAQDPARGIRDDRAARHSRPRRGPRRGLPIAAGGDRPGRGRRHGGGRPDGEAETRQYCGDDRRGAAPQRAHRHLLRAARRARCRGGRASLGRPHRRRRAHPHPHGGEPDAAGRTRRLRRRSPRRSLGWVRRQHRSRGRRHAVAPRRHRPRSDRSHRDPQGGGGGHAVRHGGLGRRGADLLEAGSAGRAALGRDDLARLLHLPAVALRSRGGVRPVADVAGLRGRQPARHGTVPNDHARGRPPEPVLRHHHTAVPGVRAQLSEGTVRDRLRRHLLGLGRRRHAGGDVLRERALLCRERAVRRRAARSRCGHRPQGTRGRVARDPADRSPQAAPHHPVHRCAPRDAEQQQQHLCAANKRDLQPPGARDLRDAPSHRPALAADRTRGLHRSRQSDGRAVIRYRA